MSAAASLKSAFEDYAKQFDAATVRYSFAGSDELAAQIRQGVKPDVYAAANTKLPDQLFKDGLVEKPTVFAGNRLVIAVPADSDIDSIDDLSAGRRRRRGGRRVGSGRVLHARGAGPPAAGREQGDRRQLPLRGARRVGRRRAS